MTSIKNVLIPVATAGGLLLALSLNHFYERNYMLQQSQSLVKPQRSFSATQASGKGRNIFADKQNRAANTAFNKGGDEVYGQQLPLRRNNSLSLAQSTNRDNSTPNAERSLLRLKEYLKRIEERNEDLKEKLDLITRLLDAKEIEVKSLQSDNANLKGKVEEGLRLQEQLRSEFEANLRKMNEQLHQKDYEINNLAKAKVELEATISDLNTKLSGLSNAHAVLGNQLNEVQQEKSQLESSLGKMQEEKSQIILELTKAKDDLKRQMDLIAQVTQEKDSLESELNKLKGDFTKQIELNAALNQGIVSLKEELANHEKELEQLRTSRKDLETELEALRTMKAESEVKISQLKARLAEIDSHEADAKSSVSQMSMLMSEKEKEVADKEKEIASIKERLDSVVREKEALALSVQEKNENINTLKVRLNEMEERAKKLQEELSASRQGQMQTKEELDKTLTQNEFLQKRLRNIQIEFDLLRAEKRKSDDPY